MFITHYMSLQDLGTRTKGRHGRQCWLIERGAVRLSALCIVRFSPVTAGADVSRGTAKMTIVVVVVIVVSIVVVSSSSSGSSINISSSIS